MIYRAIGIMSGSSLDGLDIAFTEFTETGGKWSFEVLAAACTEYSEEWSERLRTATTCNALDYQLLHAEYGHYIGTRVNEFIGQHQLQHKVQLLASHGHTSFHLPHRKMTAQLGDGAAIAATTQLNVVSDLRAMDVALGGQGAPIVPVGEKLLFAQYPYLLNIGGIANLSINNKGQFTAGDICAANRVLNMLSAQNGLPYDDGGKLARSGEVEHALLNQLNQLDYYHEPWPKSLANSFGLEIVLPLIAAAGLSTNDALATYSEHIALQVTKTLQGASAGKMLVTGGGAFNTYLIERLEHLLADQQIVPVIPDKNLVEFKEAIIMGLLGVLRWREEVTSIPAVTGAIRASVGGALWLG